MECRSICVTSRPTAFRMIILVFWLACRMIILVFWLASKVTAPFLGHAKLAPAIKFWSKCLGLSGNVWIDVCERASGFLILWSSSTEINQVNESHVFMLLMQIVKFPVHPLYSKGFPSVIVIAQSYCNIQIWCQYYCYEEVVFIPGSRKCRERTESECTVKARLWRGTSFIQINFHAVLVVFAVGLRLGQSLGETEGDATFYCYYGPLLIKR